MIILAALFLAPTQYWTPLRGDCAKLSNYECLSQHCEHADCHDERARFDDAEDYKPHYSTSGHCLAQKMIEKYGKPYTCDNLPEATCKLTVTANGYRIEATNGTCTFELQRAIEYPYFGNKSERK